MKASSKKEKRLNNYSTYRLMLTAWMINEISIVFTPVEMSHNGFYLHAVLYTLSVIFIGIPLVYSEICIAQFTKFDAINMWNFFPLFKSVGYASIYLVVLRVIYLNILSSWYMLFGLYSAVNPPPWYTCIDFDDPNCMVKRVNTSVFQHCLEAQALFGMDCGAKTASNCFFEREIENVTTITGNCFRVWKPVGALCATNLALCIFCIKEYKFCFTISKSVILMFSIVIFVLLCVSLSTYGTWFTKKGFLRWQDLRYISCLYIMTRGILTCGTGTGVIGFLTRGVSFRSPAPMTAILVSLFGVISTIFLSLILFNGIKTMTYYHGEEENVLEVDSSTFFDSFGSVIEILSYFANMPLWSFLWFITLYLCLSMDIWIMYLFLYDNVCSFYKFDKKRPAIYYWIPSIIIIIVISYPFNCTDLTEVLTDVTEMIQLVNIFLFSIALYWIYGYKNHITDITFMIGIKPSIFLKIAWILNPLIIAFNVYVRLLFRESSVNNNSFYIAIANTEVDNMLFWTLISIYIFILIIGTILQIRYYIAYDNIINIFYPTENWGPQDKVLFKSRKMFVPEIMTTEFLYRQVKIHGYSKNKRSCYKRNNKKDSEELTSYKTAWNPMTSN